MPSLRISFNTHFDVLYDIFVQFVNRFGGSGDCLSWRGDRLSDRARADPHRLGMWDVYRDLRAVSRTDGGAPRRARNRVYCAAALLTPAQRGTMRAVLRADGPWWRRGEGQRRAERCM